MIKEITTAKLRQLQGVISLLTDAQISSPVQVLNGATLGMHLRHIIEFYNCLLLGSRGKRVNYDERIRDKKLEQDPKYCCQYLDELIGSLTDVSGDFPLTLIADYAREVTLKNEVEVRSSFYRELLYNLEHMVHHEAILKIGILQLDPEFPLEEDFGVAVSTLKNRAICAR